ncbi:MAG TPA: DUF951 family protein [Dehalococcoidia bacterium]|nr:DUF951 family protein [Dehalococcoidia bacterium]
MPGQLEPWPKKSATRSTNIHTRLGDIVRLRKAHPGGSHGWEALTVGDGLGLKCHRSARENGKRIQLSFGTLLCR